MSSEIVKSVVCNNYNDFQHVNFIFSQNFISLFWGLFNDETNLKVRYIVNDLRWGVQWNACKNVIWFDNVNTNF
jgi:hypothetical protein